MFLKTWFFLIIFVFTTHLSRAQTGCLVAGGNVYTVEEGALVNVILGLLVGPGYKGSPINQYGPCVNNSQYVYIADNLRNCRVCTGAGFTITVPGVVVTCSSTIFNGKIATSQIINCPLDDYSWALGASIAAFGIFVIRKRK